MSKQNRDTKAFVRDARRAARGLDESAVMIGIIDASDERARWEFCLQVGHCLLDGKPIVLLVAHGARLPEKLRAAASAVEYYDPADPKTLEAATVRALTAVSVIPRVH